MKNEIDHDVRILAQSAFGAIHRCRCRGYHLNLRNINLHFSLEEFVALVDLFRQAEEREEGGGEEDETGRMRLSAEGEGPLPKPM